MPRNKLVKEGYQTLHRCLQYLQATYPWLATDVIGSGGNAFSEGASIVYHREASRKESSSATSNRGKSQVVYQGWNQDAGGKFTKGTNHPRVAGARQGDEQMLADRVVNRVWRKRPA